MIEKLICIILIFISIAYAKFFLKKLCYQEIRGFRKRIKKHERHIKLAILVSFFLINTIIIAIYENYIFLLFLALFILSIIFYRKNKERYSLFVYYITFPLLLSNAMIMSLLSIVFNLIYFSLD